MKKLEAHQCHWVGPNERLQMMVDQKEFPMMVVGHPLVVSLVDERCQNRKCHEIVHQKFSRRARTCESKDGELKGCDCCEMGDDK